MRLRAPTWLRGTETEMPLKSVSNANRSEYLMPACFAAARKACLSALVVEALVPSMVGALESSTNHAVALSSPEASTELCARAEAASSKLPATIQNGDLNNDILLSSENDGGTKVGSVGTNPTG